MKKILMIILILSSCTLWAQEETETPVEFETEARMDPETTYESEMFAQKQEEMSFSSSPMMDFSEEEMAEEEVYDSETDY